MRKALFIAFVLAATLITDVSAQRGRGSADVGGSARPRPSAPRISRPSRPPAPRVSRPSTPRVTRPQRPAPRPSYRPTTPRTTKPTTPRSTSRPTWTTKPAQPRPSTGRSYRDRVPTRTTPNKPSTRSGWKTITPKAPSYSSRPRSASPSTRPDWGKSRSNTPRPGVTSGGSLGKSNAPRPRVATPKIKRKFTPKTSSATVRPSKPRGSKPPVKPRNDVRPRPLGKGPAVSNPKPRTGAPGAATPLRPVDKPASKQVKDYTPKGGVKPSTSQDRTSFAVGVFGGNGNASVSLFASNINVPTSHGAVPYNYHYGPAVGVAGCGYWANCFNNAGFGIGVWNGWCGPWYRQAYGWGILNYAWYRNRWAFGFGFSYAPNFYGNGWFYNTNFQPCWHPYYRTYAYYPYTYYDTVSYFPAYSTVYHTTGVVVDYADTSDPYVEFTDAVPAGEVVEAPTPLAPPLPEAFSKPLVSDFPGGLSNAELLARGTTWLSDGEYMLSAEAFRRAWAINSGDAYPPLKLATALLGAGGRYGLAGFALHESLDRDPTSIERHPPLADEFSDALALRTALTDLKRHVVRNPTDGEARFLLGAALFWSGDAFAARNEFRALREGQWTSAHVAPFLKSAEDRLLAK